MSQQVMSQAAKEDLEIAQLTDLYQQQLAELNACHTILIGDQQLLAQMLAPFLDPAGKLPSPQQIDPKILLFKDGLDLRISEFQEDCKRIQQTERRLQRKIEQAALDYEQQFLSSSSLVDQRVLKKIKEQQRVIQVQQSELDQTRFERDTLKEENKRLREICVEKESPVMMKWSDKWNEWKEPVSIHQLTQANEAPKFGTKIILPAEKPAKTAATAEPGNSNSWSFL
jgi:hypothetical protein